MLVAALCNWHERHEACLVELQAALAGALVLPAHVVLETYAVLTRLPSSHRVPPAQARAVLEATLRRTPLVPLSAEGTWSLVADLAGAGVPGGRTYDAAILAAAREGGAEMLVTLNVRHFEGLAGDDIIVREPSAGT